MPIRQARPFASRRFPRLGNLIRVALNIDDFARINAKAVADDLLEDGLVTLTVIDTA